MSFERGFMMNTAHTRRALVVGRHRHRRADRFARTRAPGWEVHGLARRSEHLPEASSPSRPTFLTPTPRGGACRPPAGDRDHHRLDPQGHRGREHRGQRRHAAQPVCRARARRRRAARRADDRAQALPRPVRGLRDRREGRHPVPRGRSRGCRAPTSTTRRRTSCSPPPSASASPGACTARTPSSASPPATR